MKHSLKLIIVSKKDLNEGKRKPINILTLLYYVDS